MGPLWTKSKDDLKKQLEELKSELGQLRVQKITGGASSKLTRMYGSLSRLLLHLFHHLSSYSKFSFLFQFVTLYVSPPFLSNVSFRDASALSVLYAMPSLFLACHGLPKADPVS